MSRSTFSQSPSTTAAKPPSAAQVAELERVKDAIRRMGDLPTLPQVAVEVSRLAANPVTAMPELVRVIHDDPSLTAKILRVANSAFYGMSGNVESLNMALSILGMRELIHLVTCISVFHAFPVKPGQPTFDRKAFWIHSAGCGEIARDLSKRLNLRLKSTEFTAGLLHDLGKIVLDQNFHDDFMEALKLSYSEDVPMVEAESRVLGVNHTEVGRWLAELWNLPQSICQAIAYHHDLKAAGPESRPLVATICLANAFCKSVGVGFSGNTMEERLIGGPAWEVLKQQRPEAVQFDVEAFQFEIEDNIARAQEFVSIALA